MEGLGVISESTVEAENEGDLGSKIELTPWDLRFLRTGGIQKGLLFHIPNLNDVALNTVLQLKHSLSSTLHLFPQLAGRLSIEEHVDGTCSVSIICNNLGVLFVHAVAHNTSVSDILQPTYVPLIVRSFFPLNGVKNYEGTSKPLLGVQVTQLLDGVFIGCFMNHCVGDGTSFWNFFRSWAEITRGPHKVPSNPVLDRWFPVGMNRPIRFHYTKQNDKSDDGSGLITQPPPQRVFHFTKQNIAQLKAKANAEVKAKVKNDDVNKTTISSFQAIISHIWGCIIEHQHLDPQEQVSLILAIGCRHRILDPPLEDNYFGNALHVSILSMKAGELVEGGLGNCALEMNKLIGLHTQEKLKSYYEGWIKNPVLGGGLRKHTVVTSSSPRFHVYGNDFGWGKPMAVRSGVANIADGKITLYEGAEEGSIDVEVCAAYEILEAIGKDSHFMNAVSIESM